MKMNYIEDCRMRIDD